MPKIVLDASALLAWAQQEKGWQTIDRLLPVAAIASANMIEVLYRARERGFTGSDDTLHALVRGAGVAITSVEEADVIRAAGLIEASRARKIGGTLSLGDGICLAAAERLKLPVTGGDQHWETLDLKVPYHPFR